MTRFEHDSVISGVGQSTIGRRLGLSAIELTTQSCLAAIADAGLTTADIDGLSTYPGGDAAATPVTAARRRTRCKTRCGCP